jgi:predicted permease
MARFRKGGKGLGGGNEDRQGGFNPPDLAMVLMLLGAVCKFFELGVFREGIQRYVSAALGGLLIAIGSALVTWNSIVAIRQASREVSALKQSVANAGADQTEPATT